LFSGKGHLARAISFLTERDMSISGLEVSDKKITAALRTMRTRWSEGFRNPHGAAAEPSWVSNAKHAAPLPRSHVNKANRTSTPVLPPRANVASTQHSTPKSGKPGGVDGATPAGLRALQALNSERQAAGREGAPDRE
jgi:hypothetical protein